MKKDVKEFYARDRKVWRSWLSKNYQISKGVWLVLHKKNSNIKSVTYDEAVEEALCYGWIDSKPNKKDKDSYLLYFAERKPKSVWSAMNKRRIEKLLQQGKMTEAGQAKIDEAKRNGSWEALDDIEALRMPEPLKSAFLKNKKALQNFEAFPPGIKKGIYQWIISAKQKETLDRRIKETVTLAAKNERANQWKKK